MRQTYGDLESRQSDDYFDERNINQVEDPNNSVAVYNIEKDTDLSLANSTIQKVLCCESDKDCDLSLDVDESDGTKEIVANNNNNNIFSGSLNKFENDTIQKFQERNVTGKIRFPENRNSPSPPLSEIWVPLSHDYGYGYYLKPLWSLNYNPNNVLSGGRIQRVRQLISEGKKLRKKRITQSYVNVTKE